MILSCSSIKNIVPLEDKRVCVPVVMGFWCWSTRDHTSWCFITFINICFQFHKRMPEKELCLSFLILKKILSKLKQTKLKEQCRLSLPPVLKWLITKMQQGGCCFRNVLWPLTLLKRPLERKGLIPDRM